MGLPDKTFADDQINFNIRRMNDDNLFSHIRWRGYISFPHTSDFQFKISSVEGHCMLWIGGEVVLDTIDESAVGSFRAYENVLYEIEIEYSLVSCLFGFHPPSLSYLSALTSYPSFP